MRTLDVGERTCGRCKRANECELRTNLYLRNMRRKYIQSNVSDRRHAQFERERGNLKVQMSRRPQRFRTELGNDVSHVLFFPQLREVRVAINRPSRTSPTDLPLSQTVNRVHIRITRMCLISSSLTSPSHQHHVYPTRSRGDPRAH